MNEKIIIGLVILSVVAVLGVLIYQLVDVVGLEKYTYDAVVINKNFTPAHSVTTMRSQKIGETTIMVPHTDHYPDRWDITVEVDVEDVYETDNRHDVKTFTVGEQFYNSLKIGDNYNVFYVVGRLSKKVQIVGLN